MNIFYAGGGALGDPGQLLQHPCLHPPRENPGNGPDIRECWDLSNRI